MPLTIALSTDKAVNPVNLYGATKLCAEKIFAQADVYAPDGPRALRLGALRQRRRQPRQRRSRSSSSRRATGVLTITDERMTRFWITLEAAVEFVLSSMDLVQGGETFVPKIPSMRIVDLADAIAPDAERASSASAPARSCTRCW